MVKTIGSCFKVNERWFGPNRQVRTRKGHISKGGRGGRCCVDKRKEWEGKAVFWREGVEGVKGRHFKGV